MKALKIIGSIAFVVVFLAFGFILGFVPDKSHVEKSIVISAPATAIFPHLNSMKKFNVWSPWIKMEPEAKQSFEGAEAGVGAKMSWVGDQTGKGTQWITESVENESVKTALTFEGEEGEAGAEFKLSPEGDRTKVMWTFDGESKGFVNKAKWIIGGYFVRTAYESGLQDLKKLVESAQAVESVQETVPTDSTSIK